MFRSNLTPQIYDGRCMGQSQLVSQEVGCPTPDACACCHATDEEVATACILRHNSNWNALRVRGMDTGGRVQKDANNRAR